MRKPKNPIAESSAKKLLVKLGWKKYWDGRFESPTSRIDYTFEHACKIEGIKLKRKRKCPKSIL